MTQSAHGTFEVTITPHEPDDGIGRMTIAKTWSGDLAGSGHGLMLSAGDPTQGRAGYVALEIVEGTLHGRAGSLAFQQLGVMRDGDQELRYDVVPGSGTGELAGIDGTLALTIDGRGHTYELSYTLG
ncbi:MAG TPA: DUF3224 domain-containing protein [Nocardioides sp.]|jgi:hypothetical protein|nr:DUF3224 domain-containing protein [Nocardioides sp.]